MYCFYFLFFFFKQKTAYEMRIGYWSSYVCSSDLIRAECGDESALMSLADAVEQAADWMLSAGVNDRLAGSYPFLSMAAVVTCGWLMARQGRIAGEMQAKGEGDLAFLKAKQVDRKSTRLNSSH